ncbi:MAG: hypothetical protein EA425_03270 [Puniceicoccaceae bacterium]|nr:MAG: hypothetical protein EA425_03270 [Puniceicoccaceae bacterium]
MPTALTKAAALIACMAAFSGGTIQAADTIINWDLAGVPNSPVPTVLPATLAEGLESDGLLRGPGVGAANLTNGYSANTFTPGSDNPSRATAIAKGEYIGFAFRVRGGFVASLDAVQFSLRRSAVNAPLFYELQYSLDNFATPGVKVADFTYRGRSSGTNTETSTEPSEYMRFGAPDSYTDESFELPPDLAGQSGGVNDAGNPIPVIDLSSIAELQHIPGGTTVTFALFAWGNASTTTGNTVAFGRINGPVVTGSVIDDPDLGDDIILEVRSEFPSTDPAPGINTFPMGTLVEASASPVVEGSMRRLPVGWTGSGSVQDGAGDSLSFLLNEASLLEWQWAAENLLTVGATGGGGVRVRTTERFPLLGFDFNGWVFLPEEELGPGQQSNINGVPSSLMAEGIDPTTIVRGPGLTPRHLGAGGISSENWNGTPSLDDAIAGGKYLEFSLVPTEEGPFEINSMYLPYRYTQTGPHSLALLYSFDDFATWTVVEALRIQDQASGTQLGNHLFTMPPDPALRELSQPVTFRIYGWGGTGTGVGTFTPTNENGPGIADLVVFGGASQTVTVTGTSELWRNAEALLEVEAFPAPGHIFVGWSGPVFSNQPKLAGLSMASPLTLGAVFDTSSEDDGIPDSWRQLFFGPEIVAADVDHDGDGFTVREEYLRGSNPTVPEPLLATDGLTFSSWENVQRDPQVPGRFLIRDFGGGFRGAWENSNDNRSALTPFRPDGGPVAAVDHTSYDGPRMIIRPEVWEESWSNGTVSTVFSVGDDDGVSLYFRYVDELNWYRVTICGEDGAPSRPRLGVSVEKRVEGEYAQLAFDNFMATDPADLGFFKRVRISVEQDGGSFLVRVTGWDEFITPPDFNPDFETVFFITDDSHPEGRAGIGAWAMGGHTFEEPEWNPVDSGVLFESFEITAGPAVVFTEDWSGLLLANVLPAGWTNAFADEASLEGVWLTTAHGTVLQASGAGGGTSGTSGNPRADADGPLLVRSLPALASYILELGFHPFDAGAIGFVFDYQDEDNYGRVLFARTFGPAGGSIPTGVAISRKTDGQWTDLVVGDPTFAPTLGQPFQVSFSRSGARYVMNARAVDDPDTVHRWEWEDPSAASAGHRFGFTSWQAGNAHFLYADVYGIEAAPEDGLEVVAIQKVGDMILLTVRNPSGEPYNVQRTLDVSAGPWATVDTNQTGMTWTGAIPAGAGRVFWRLTR